MLACRRHCEAKALAIDHPCFALYSGLIELIQPRVNRYGEWMDFMANVAPADWRLPVFSDQQAADEPEDSVIA